MFCPKCGTKNVDEAKFCVACGNPFPAASVTPPSVKTDNPAVASDMVPGVAPAPQAVSAQPGSKASGKKRLPLIIGGAAAGVIALMLIAIFIVAPAFNKNPFKGCQVGDAVEFGSYEQDGNASNGKEPIEWRVLAVEGNRAYVVSQKALDAHAFNADEDDNGEDDNDWNSSDLKKWLENDFASQAFTGDEMKEIDGAPTLLSVDEANKYFMSDEDRRCYLTNRLKQQSGWDSDDNVVCVWWLRSPGSDSGLAAGVGMDGDVVSNGGCGVDSDFFVRPALWINL